MKQKIIFYEFLQYDIIYLPTGTNTGVILETLEKNLKYVVLDTKHF